MLKLFKKKESGIDVLCGASSIPSGEENIVYKAVDLLAEETGLKAGVEAVIKKGIPAGSGLGGGSSDAAGSLAAVNALFNLGLNKSGLISAGRKIGADVPFFISLLDESLLNFTGGAYIGRGRGDKISFAGLIEDVWFVIVYPGISVSTADVYGALSLTGERRDIKMILEHVRRGDKAGISSCLFNRLEPAAFGKHPCISEIKERLLKAGAAGALMTGSGSAVFGIAPGRDAAFDIKRKIMKERKEADAYVARGL